MDVLNYDPLDNYNDRLQKTHEQNVEEYFDELVKRSGIDVEENKKTVALYKQKQDEIGKLKRRGFWLKFLLVTLIIVAVVSLIVTIASFSDVWFVTIPLIVVSLVLIFALVRPKLKRINSSVEDAEKEAKALYDKALAQMQPLNALFTDDDTLNLFEKTYPEFHFEKTFSSSMANELSVNYDMPRRHNDEVTVVDTLSGRYNKNPFVYLRRRIHKMGTEIYHGYKTISWTESYTDSKGNRRTRLRTQTLHAQVERPKPYYKIDTALTFGAGGAPDLTFSREGKNINLKSDKAIERAVKRGEKKLNKKASKAVTNGGGFMSMTNTQFDVLFGAVNRDNEVQFRVMFTPLAQTNMVELILSDDTFGDDFDFYKFKRCNVIRSDHAQSWNMDTSASRYHSYSYEDAKSKFETINNYYFKSVYFDFAPLLAVPVYHDDVNVAPPAEVKGQRLADEEYEAFANGIGAGRFAHPQTRTDAILKSRYLTAEGDEEIIEITAYSYRTEDRMEFIPVPGGDGRIHAVPVPWIEYIPVSNKSNMRVKIRENDTSGKDENAASAIRNKIMSYIK